MAWAVCYLLNASGNLTRPLKYEQLLVELLGEERVEQKILERERRERELTRGG